MTYRNENIPRKTIEIVSFVVLLLNHNCGVKVTVEDSLYMFLSLPRNLTKNFLKMIDRWICK